MEVVFHQHENATQDNVMSPANSSLSASPLRNPKPSNSISNPAWLEKWLLETRNISTERIAMMEDDETHVAMGRIVHTQVQTPKPIMHANQPHEGTKVKVSNVATEELDQSDVMSVATVEEDEESYLEQTFDTILVASLVLGTLGIGITRYYTSS